MEEEGKAKGKLKIGRVGKERKFVLTLYTPQRRSEYSLRVYIQYATN